MLVNTWLCSRAMRFQSRPTNWPLLTIESPVAQWLEHPTRSRRVVGSNPIWDSELFSESTFLLIFNIVILIIDCNNYVNIYSKYSYNTIVYINDLYL